MCMSWSFKGMLYQMFIDPLISGLRKKIVRHVVPEDSILEVACGTGALSLVMARKARHVTGIDLSEDMIVTARRQADRSGMKNLKLEIRDASDLSCYADDEFDVAVASMAMHQFEARLAVKILAEMGRIAGRVIIADYNIGMRRNISSALAWSIEFMAAGDHYRNFRIYMQNGGMPWLAGMAGIRIRATDISGGGVFAVSECIRNAAM